MFEAFERSSGPPVDVRFAALAFGDLVELDEIGDLDGTDLHQLADNSAVRHGIDPRLLRAVVSVESSWNPRAYRHEPKFFDRYVKGTPWMKLWGGDSRRLAASYGLGQLMYSTAVRAGFPRDRPPEDLYDPRVNLDLTARHLAGLNHRFGNVRDVAAAYNSGRPFAKAPAYTRNTYVPRVLSRLGGPVAVAGGGINVRSLAWGAAAVVALGLIFSGR